MLRMLSLVAAYAQSHQVCSDVCTALQQWEYVVYVEVGVEQSGRAHDTTPLVTVLYVLDRPIELFAFEPLIERPQLNKTQCLSSFELWSTSLGFTIMMNTFVYV